MTTRVDYHESAERELAMSGNMRDLMRHIGNGIARDARAHAPVGHPSHGGAASIHAVTDLSPRGWEVKVSWSPSHYYMSFSEVGSRYMHARPFLRPALERARI
jgi:HK97 gp10 family phage protein